MALKDGPNYKMIIQILVLKAVKIIDEGLQNTYALSKNQAYQKLKFHLYNCITFASI